MTSLAFGTFDPEKRAKELFQNIFENMFHTNSNQPLNFEQVKEAMENSLPYGVLNDQESLTVEEIFKTADKNSNGELSKREILDFIVHSLQNGLFPRFFSMYDEDSLEAADMIF